MYVVISTVWRQQRLSQQAPNLCKLSSFRGFDISDGTYAIFSSWLFGIFVLRRYTSPRSKASQGKNVYQIVIYSGKKILFNPFYVNTIRTFSKKIFHDYHQSIIQPGFRSNPNFF